MNAIASDADGMQMVANHLQLNRKIESLDHQKKIEHRHTRKGQASSVLDALIACQLQAQC